MSEQMSVEDMIEALMDICDNESHAESIVRRGSAIILADRKATVEKCKRATLKLLDAMGDKGIYNCGEGRFDGNSWELELALDAVLEDKA